MSIGSVYESAYKGDYNQVKVKIDQNKSLVTTPDEVSLQTSSILFTVMSLFNILGGGLISATLHVAPILRVVLFKVFLYFISEWQVVNTLGSSWG